MDGDNLLISVAEVQLQACAARIDAEVAAAGCVLAQLPDNVDVEPLARPLWEAVDRAVQLRKRVAEHQAAL
jgi:hypothetical protein